MTIITLKVTPALTHWLPAIAACANPIDDFGIVTQIVPPEDLNLDEADLVLRMGEQHEDDPFSAVMGSEKLVVVAGKEVPLTSLSISTLQAIYTGLLFNWTEVPEINSGAFESTQPIQPLTFPEGYELRHLFTAAYLNANDIYRDALVFSTSDTLKTYLTAHPFSIAYLLESQVPDGFRILNITGFTPSSTQALVLAVTDQEPEGKLRQLLLCLQDSQ